MNIALDLNRELDLNRNISIIPDILLDNLNWFALCEDWLLNLLGNFPHLVSLKLYRFGLSQRFLDQLVGLSDRLTASLEELVLFDTLVDRDGQRLVNNLPVLFRFERLRSFECNMLTDELTWQFISQLRCPANFRFTFAQTTVLTVHKWRNAEASIRYDYQQTVLHRDLTAAGQDLTFDELQEHVHRFGRLDERV